MNTLTKLALGLMGQLKPQPPIGDATTTMPLPPPRRSGGLPLMEALRQRQSQREFAPKALRKQQLSDLLWAAAGINRPTLGGRTAPSAMNAQEVLVYATDVRRVTGYQDFVDTAPLDLVYVADHARMRLVPAAMREAYAYAAAGAMAQNVYLCCASAGLATVIRAWFDRDALARAMALGNELQLLLAQTVGLPGEAAP